MKHSGKVNSRKSGEKKHSDVIFARKIYQISLKSYSPHNCMIKKILKSMGKKKREKTKIVATTIAYGNAKIASNWLGEHFSSPNKLILKKMEEISKEKNVKIEFVNEWNTS